MGKCINYNKNRDSKDQKQNNQMVTKSNNKETNFSLNNMMGADIGKKQNDNDNLFYNFKNSSLLFGGTSNYSQMGNNTTNVNNNNISIVSNVTNKNNTLNALEMSKIDRSDLSSATSNILEDSSLFNNSMTSISGSQIYNNIKVYDDNSTSMFGASIFLNKPLNINNQITTINSSMNQFFSVSEYFYKEEQNIKYRNTMEDYSKVIDKFMNDPNKGFFSLYDGHGGSDPVKYCKERMPELLTKAIIDNPKDIEKAITLTFQNIDYELTFTDSENIGTTASIVYIFKDEKGNKNLVCANVGDSRCIHLSKNNCKRLSYDHKCTDQGEADRIKSSGGIIFSNRVFGQLVLSRALGDHALKKYGVIATPHYTKIIVNEGDYVVLGSDGIWDVVTDDDALKYSKEYSSAEEFAKFLVKTALLQGSKDNISCLVIKI